MVNVIVRKRVTLALAALIFERYCSCFREGVGAYFQVHVSMQIRVRSILFVNEHVHMCADDILRFMIIWQSLNLDSAA